MPNRKQLRKKDHEPHDAVFKAFFSDAKIARNYLLHYTPEAIHGQIDFGVFQKIDTAFVSGRFGISFSDVLYEACLLSGASARLLFLFEHKSYLPEDWAAFIPNFHYVLTDLSRIPLQEIEEKVETEYLKNLFLALKFARSGRFALKEWPNVLTFGKPFYRSDREGILFQTNTLRHQFL